MGGAARVMPIRESLIPYLLARGVGRENIRVIPHGIDLTPFTRPPVVDIYKMFGIPDGKGILAFAGRLSPENYVNEMLDAVRHLGRQRDDFVLVLAGGGPLEGEISARLAEDPVLARAVRPVGFVSQETVRALRGVCRVSLCLMGGFSLIEACAAGRPVIAYDVDWHHELVVDGITGRLVPEHHIDGVAEAIGELLDDEAKAQQMGAAGRALAFARHDIHVASENRRRCYAELID
jgi:glycosyltransferase involved in cell wall biosynthesis